MIKRLETKETFGPPKGIARSGPFDLDRTVHNERTLRPLNVNAIGAIRFDWMAHKEGRCRRVREWARAGRERGKEEWTEKDSAQEVKEI